MQTPIKPQLDKRLHFPFSEGGLAAGTNHPPTYNRTLKISYWTGGNNQLGPQKEAHHQFRYSAARDWTHRPVHPPRHPRLLRKRRRPAGVPGMAGSAWSGTDGKKGRKKVSKWPNMVPSVWRHLFLYGRYLRSRIWGVEKQLIERLSGRYFG